MEPVLIGGGWRLYDNVADHRLPEEVCDPNATGSMWLYIDGTWSQGDA